MHALVIGGSGFVGRGIVNAFLANGHQVSVLNRGTTPVIGTRQLTADRNDAPSVRSAVSGLSFDIVIDSSGYTEAQVRIAVEAMGERAGQWVQISSAAVYAPATSVPLDETATIGDHPAWREYGADKAAADAWLANSSMQKRLTILRPTYIFGPGNNLDREQFVWRRLHADRPILVPGNGQTVAQFIHVDDLADAVLRIADRGPTGAPAVFNIGNRSGLTLEGWVQMLANVAGKKPKLAYVPHGTLGYVARDYFPFRDVTCYLDVTRIEVELGWKPQPLHSRFADTYRSWAMSPADSAETTVEDAILDALR